MYEYPEPVERLIEAFMQLPTIGPKSAARLSFHMLHAPEHQARELAAALIEVKEKIGECSSCGNLTDRERCSICLDPRRDPGLLCVVKDPRDVFALERTNEFKGFYHVLGGLISPMEGIGPDQLRVASLLQRVNEGSIREVILATDPTVAGEATALYLQKQLAREGLAVTRLALGLPMGSDLEYTDELTLGRALLGRQQF